MDKKSFRIHTTPGGTDKYITVSLEQNFDVLEVLSLKISQDKIYRDFSADYGVLVGRAIANDGFGIPNAKISVFIPLSSEDQNDPIISTLYPFKKITDKNLNGIRYNLINPTATNGKIGSFPNKQQVLDNDNYLEVHEKYYKFNTKTNASGDYMIFGVPVGNQLIHMDVDLSDIGAYSFNADAMIANGLSKNLFVGSQNSYKFKGGADLEKLPQIISKTISVDIKPLWGDNTTQQIGITRADFKINLDINPVAYVTFSVGFDEYDTHKGGYSSGINFGPSLQDDIYHLKLYTSLLGDSLDSASRPGALRRLTPTAPHGGNLTIKAYEYDASGNELVYDENSFKVVNTPDFINNGTCIILLPCNLHKVITDEYGNLVPSNDPNVGVGTIGKWRLEVLNNGSGGKMLNFLVQKNGDSQPFIVRSRRVYSVKMQMDDAYTLRDDEHRNVVNSGQQRPIFKPKEWLNGFLYFGYGFYDTVNDKPTWLIDNNGNSPNAPAYWYNVETHLIDVTDFLPVLTSRNNQYYDQRYNFVFIQDNEVSGVTAKLQADNTTYGDKYSDYAPSQSPTFYNSYVFLKGLYTTSDCFTDLKKYANL